MGKGQLVIGFHDIKGKYSTIIEHICPIKHKIILTGKKIGPESSILLGSIIMTSEKRGLYVPFFWDIRWTWATSKYSIHFGKWTLLT